MVPLLQTGDYDQGTIEGISYLDKLARGETFTVKENQDFNTDFFSVGLIYAIPIIWFFLSYMSNTKSWWMGGVAGAVIGFLIFQTIVGVLIIAVGGLLFDFLLSTKLFGMIKPPGGGSGGLWVAAVSAAQVVLVDSEEALVAAAEREVLNLFHNRLWQSHNSFQIIEIR